MNKLSDSDLQVYKNSLFADVRIMAAEIIELRQITRGTKVTDCLPHTIDGVASVIAHSPNTGVFPAQYIDGGERFETCNKTEPYWYDLEAETEVHDVDTWWDYPESEEK